MKNGLQLWVQKVTLLSALNFFPKQDLYYANI